MKISLALPESAEIRFSKIYLKESLISEANLLIITIIVCLVFVYY